MKYWKLLVACCVVMFPLSLPAWASGVSDGIVVVQKGQSIGSIAAQHKVSVAQICQWNKLSSPDKIRVGQKLYVRSPDQASAPLSPPAASTAPASAPSPAKSSPQAKTAVPTAPSATETHASDGVPEKVKQDLDKIAKTLVNNAAKSIMPSSKAKAVAPDSSGGYVASYVEVDTTDVRTEVLPSAEAGKYVGSIRYVEYQYECPGKSKADALKAECHMVKPRRMNEWIRYEKGKWHH